LVIDTVVCLTLAKWETVSGQFGGYLTALLVMGFFVWNSRQRNERLAVGLFIAGAVIVVGLVVVVASH
jgi:hypothetical protein